MKWTLVLLLVATSCFWARKSKGGGQIETPDGRKLNPADVRLEPGYRIEVVATGLTFPTAVAFDDAGGVHVLEAGYSYGEVFTTPRIVAVEADGKLREVAKGEKGPWTGMSFGDGAFFVADGGQGRVLRISRDGQETQVLADGLPSLGDHHTNGALFHDGHVYVGQGTATNSGVVGDDNAAFGWLARHPDFHDVPCRDVKITGHRYTSKDGKETSPYAPFGKVHEPGAVVPGNPKCTGAILRVPAGGGDVEVVAWGFRNPFGLAFAPDGALYATDNGYDDRGARPVFGAADMLWKVEPGKWHGWPDHSEGRPLTRGRYAGKTDVNLLPVFAEAPNEVPKPAAYLAVHSSSDGLDFSRSARFGHVGEAFIAQFGDQAPAVGKVLHPVGFRIVRVNPADGVVFDFAVNRGTHSGPASKLGHGGLERPVAVRFDPSGDALYVVDFGIMTMDGEAPKPMQRTGVLWKITREVRR